MRTACGLAVLTFLSIVHAGCQPTAEPTMTYPVTNRGDVVDDYSRHEVADPYRWLEDLDSKESPPGWPRRTRSPSRTSRRCRCASTSSSG